MWYCERYNWFSLKYGYKWVDTYNILMGLICGKVFCIIEIKEFWFERLEDVGRC